MIKKYLEINGLDFKFDETTKKITIYKTPDDIVQEYNLGSNYPQSFDIKLLDITITITTNNLSLDDFNITFHWKDGTEVLFNSGKKKMEFAINSLKEGYKYGIDLTSKKFECRKSLQTNNYYQKLKYDMEDEPIFQIVESITGNVNSLKKECIIEPDESTTGYYRLKTLADDYSDNIALFPEKTARSIARHLMATEEVKAFITEVLKMFRTKMPELTNFIFENNTLACILITELNNVPKINPYFEEIVACSHITSEDVAVLFQHFS